ncbi:alpha-L-fucosidase [Mucilaginibacter ginsenosidivorans]|uniref:alpha-L-fucosidase n=1 Tax=Mucilaginibacter ginsenosidivorans TaxID=398053 RepID=A0A5B8UW81_9SPHI|nr:alpha-L-fucosidase [Mucilaginibacter ginsenosidivorans]QEC63172.1 glycoside hydrolase [Mucilaginibacter ginsenosidivorans]
MKISRRKAVKTLALAIPALKFMPGYAFGQTVPAIQDGPFTGTRESLKSYVIPEWFRDAKFGIWAHWGPQSAIEAGDWYARNMYMEDSGQYKHFVTHYGHQSKIGYKDTIPKWKAEKFDADHLVGLYKKAGAKYFMSMGVHHDNFDLWNSKYNHWNSVKMGPKIDIVGEFKKATQKHGLKFGISDHLWISPNWFSTSKGADKDGPYAGIKYDGANPQYASLYGNSPKVYTDLPWNEDGIPESWKKHWFLRIKDLVDQYQPDLLYCDGAIPFEEHGLSMLAHLYNQSAAKNGGIAQSVYTSKRAEDSQVGTCVFDVERGVVDSIWPRPWQTDTCIGDWHYNRDTVGHYKSAKTVVDMLVDIVSRNGNLMLNFPLPASGMLDNDELVTLDGITKWMAVNNEAIYATRPWKIYGISPPAVVPTGTSFNESKRLDLTYNDIRFTTKGKTLYAFFMGWPHNGQLLIKPLAENNAQRTGKIENIELLGYGKVEYSRDNEGLKVNLPSQKPCEHAYALKLSGIDLT